MPWKDKNKYQSESYREYISKYQRDWHQRNKEQRIARIFERKESIRAFYRIGIAFLRADFKRGTRLVGFEPPTLGSEDRCSNPLSYRRNISILTDYPDSVNPL
jgi:ribosomal protein S4